MFIAELLLGLINICYQCFNKDKKEEEKDANFDSSVLTGDLFLSSYPLLSILSF